MGSNSCNKRRQLTLRIITQSKHTQKEEEAKAISSNWPFLFPEDQLNHHLTRWPLQFYKRLSIGVRCLEDLLAWIDFDEGGNWKTQRKSSKSDEDRLKLGSHAKMTRWEALLLTITPAWQPKEYIRDFSRMVTHPVFNVITQGLNSVNRLQSASPFGASRATLDLLQDIKRKKWPQYQRLLQDSRSGVMRNMLKDDIKRKYCYLAETTLLRSFKFALTDSVSTYSGETKGSLLPLAIQNPSKLQNSPPPRGISRGWFKMLEGFTCPSKNRWMRDWTVGWDERSNCVRKLKQNP